MYYDKSNTILKEWAFDFYLVHAILLKFTLEVQKQLIQQGMTIVGHLPTSFFRNETDVLTSTSGLSRRDRVLMIRKCLKAIISPLDIHAQKGILTQKCDNIPLRIHPVLFSYVADLPEAKDLTGVLNGNQSNRNCHE